MAATQLDRGSIERLKRHEGIDGSIRLQVSSLQKKDDSRYSCSLTDGATLIAGLTSSQVSKQVAAGEVSDWNILSVSNFTCNSNNGKDVLVLLGCEVLAEGDAPENNTAAQSTTPAAQTATKAPSATPAAPSTAAAAAAATPVVQSMTQAAEARTPAIRQQAQIPEDPTPTPAAKKIKVEADVKPEADVPLSPVKPGTEIMEQAPSIALPEAQGPLIAVPEAKQEDVVMPDAPAVPEPAAATEQATPHADRGKENRPSAPLHTPAAAVKPLGWNTPSSTAGRTPPSTVRTLTGRPTQPIQALNPYNCGWTIRARVANKTPKRSYSRNGAEQSVFSVELVDAQGTQIEATLWREAAERYYDVLQEGKVYYLSRGKVKPANKAYAGVRNSYTINFDREAMLEECTDADESALSQMQAKLEYVTIDHLQTHIGKKVPVDIIGIVTTTGPLGSVKRKSDSSEVPRRDITLADQSKKTVAVTLWGNAAEEAGGTLESLEGTNPVLSISNCRVTDFNGVSVSALQRSVVAVNPEGTEAAELREWWDTEGISAPTQHAGEGLASARKGSGGTGKAWSHLKDVQKALEDLPPADAKPEWFNVTATVVLIDPAQSLYYQACPENNRKVVQQGDGWLCEYNGQVYPAMVRRYVCLGKCSDSTGEATLSFFNDQAETLLGTKADDIAQYKEGADPQQFQAILNRAQWSDWILTVQSRTQEYNGELRQRLSVQSIERLDFVKESRRMISQLQLLASAA